MRKNNKPIPKSILIFGAANHIGKPMAQYIQKTAPDVKLRLVSSNPDRAEALSNEFPNAEIVLADYFDLPSMEAALDGIEGVYMSTPQGGFDAVTASKNFIAAAKKSGTLVHVIRQIILMPEYDYNIMPGQFKEMSGGEYQDKIVQGLFNESELPVTFLNFGASFMDNMLGIYSEPLKKQRRLVMHDRLCPYIYPPEISEVAANLLLSDNHRHIGLLHTINNGHDNLRGSDVAAMMSEVFGEKITYDGTKEGFLEVNLPVLGPVAHFIWEFFEFEESYEPCWALNNFAETTLGRKPKTLSEWLSENKEAILGL